MYSSPAIPISTPDTTFSFAHSRLSARSRLNASLHKTSWSSKPSSSATSSSKPPSSTQDVLSTSTLFSPSTNTTPAAFSARHRQLARTQHRALRSLPQAGAALDLLAAELSDEEQALEEEKEAFNNFGRRFLIPIGRRNTQMEAEAAPSPTPSDHDHRQEDRAGIVSPSLEPLNEVDLDASVEDMDAAPDLDASLEDMDRSTEYDSDDLRLMNEMDRSVGSHTPDESGEMDVE